MPKGLRAERWVAVLAELEGQVVEALRNANAGTGPDANGSGASRNSAPASTDGVVIATDVGRQVETGWRPPAGLGPLPAELVARARRLAAAQQQAVDRIGSEMRSSRKHAAFVAAVPRPGSGVRSIYLDTES